jgi:hypothetical protein
VVVIRRVEEWEMPMNTEQLDRYMKRCKKSLDEINEETPYEWKVFGTLAFRYFLGHSKSRRIFYRWLAEIRKPVLPHFLNWFAVIAHDRWNNDIRIHTLIGGSKISFQPGWILRWKELGGSDAAISDYRPGVFSKHVFKNANAGHDFEAAMDLCGSGLFEIDHDQQGICKSAGR